MHHYSLYNCYRDKLIISNVTFSAVFLLAFYCRVKRAPILNLGAFIAEAPRLRLNSCHTHITHPNGGMLPPSR